MLAIMQRSLQADCLRRGCTYGLLGGHRDNQRRDEVRDIVDAAVAHPAQDRSISGLTEN